MRREDLLEAFGALDDELLMSAENNGRENIIRSFEKYGGMAACMVAVLGMAIALGIHRPEPISDPIFQGTPIEETTISENQGKINGAEVESGLPSVENMEEMPGIVDEGGNGSGTATMKEDASGDGIHELEGAMKEDASGDGIHELEGAMKEDIPADGTGEYHEEVKSDDLSKDISAIYGGSYSDAKGKLTVILTEDTPENRAAVCKSLGRSVDKTAFVTGKYTLAYLTELEGAITQGMINKEFPFVIVAGVHEMENCIIISVTTDDESLLAKVYALDTIGGAIKTERAGSVDMEILPVLE